MYRNLWPGEYLPIDSITAQPITRLFVPLDGDKGPCNVTLCPMVISQESFDFVESYGLLWM